MKLVTAAIIEKDGKFLIARRGPKSKLAGQWEFPGGKVEPGETPEACLARELHEELGITATVGEHVHSSDYHYDHGSFRIAAYRVAWIRGEMSPVDHDRIEWVKIEQLRTYPLLPADIPIAEKLEVMNGLTH